MLDGIEIFSSDAVCSDCQEQNMTITAHYAHKAVDLTRHLLIADLSAAYIAHDKTAPEHETEPAPGTGLQEPSKTTTVTYAEEPGLNVMLAIPPVFGSTGPVADILPAPWIHRAGIREYEKASRSYELAYERKGRMFDETEITEYVDAGENKRLSMQEWLMARETTILRNNSFTTVAIARKVNNTEEQNALLLEKRIQTAETQREILRAVQLSAQRQSRIESHARDQLHSDQAGDQSAAIMELAPDIPQSRNDQRIRQPIMMAPSSGVALIPPHPVSNEEWKQSLRMTPASTTTKPVKQIVNAYRVFSRPEV